MKINRASKKATRYACKNFHYAKCVPSVQYSYNIFNDNNEWCGVIVYSPGANYRIAKPFGLRQGEVIELVRVALNGKQEITSKALAFSLKQLHKDNPILKIVVSYADVDQNHSGIIYQATNWIYLGKCNQGMVGAFIINGRKTHHKTCYSRGWEGNIKWIKSHVDPKAEEFITKGKRKYIFCFDKKLRKQYLKLSKPYPKACAGEEYE